MIIALMTTNAENLKEELEQKKKELDKIRTELHPKHSAKEAAFQELKNIREKIKSHNLNIKDIKKERDNLTKEVKALKEEREKLNHAVKEKAALKKEMNNKNKDFLFNSRINPHKIKSIITKIELKLETEVMPFSQEQALNKKLKELKEEYKELEKKSHILKEVNLINREFLQKKKQAQELHYGVNNKAQQSQEKHQQINNLFEKIKQWRAEEQRLVEKSAALKLEYEQAKSRHEEIWKHIQRLGAVLKEKQLLNFKNLTKEKTREIEEKIKTGKKLNIDDILAFQSLKN